MAKTTITINATDTDGKKVRNNITYVNPEISNSNALILAQKISSFTTDTYKSSERVDVTDLDSLTPRPVTKIGYNKQIGGSATYWFSDPDNPTVSIPVANFPITNSKAEALITIVTPLDVAPIVEDLAFTGEGTFQFIDMVYGSEVAPVYEQLRWRLFIRSNAAPEVGVLTFKVSFPTSNLYDNWSRNFTFNITEE